MPHGASLFASDDELIAQQLCFRCDAQSPSVFVELVVMLNAVHGGRDGQLPQRDWARNVELPFLASLSQRVVLDGLIAFWLHFYDCILSYAPCLYCK